MARSLARLLGGVAVLVAAVGLAYVLGMRRKSPIVLDAVRRSGRAMRPLLLRSAGTPGAYASVIRHTGRTSGRAYETPVVAVATDDGFVIALPYGPNTDWLKNVLASGAATIVDEGGTYQVDRPRLEAIGEFNHLFAAADQRAHRLFGVDLCLRVQRVEGPAPDTPSPSP
jgi:deazaflavin-dependent oxidoreductase (nitroreductase family)